MTSLFLRRLSEHVENQIKPTTQNNYIGYFIEACKSGDLTTIKKLVLDGKVIVNKDSYMMSEVCCCYDRVDILQFLHSVGVDLFSTDLVRICITSNSLRCLDFLLTLEEVKRDFVFRAAKEVCYYENGRAYLKKLVSRLDPYDIKQLVEEALIAKNVDCFQLLLNYVEEKFINDLDIGLLINVIGNTKTRQALVQELLKMSRRSEKIRDL